MLSLEEALEILSQEVHSLSNARAKDRALETVSIEYKNTKNLLGRVIASDLVAPINLPEFDNSAMDGYVLRYADLDLEQETSGLAIDPQEISAGEAIRELEAKTCMRIFTGAAIPHGGDTVIPQENCEVNSDGQLVFKNADLSLGDHIRPAKQNYAKGDLVLRAGRRISPEIISILAGLGITEIALYKRLRVSLCISGSELIMPGTPLKSGQIYESNGSLLRSFLDALDCELVDYVHISDNYDETKCCLERLARTSELIICTGGVSVGDKDFIKELLSDALIRKVAIKPGKPFSFAYYNDCPVFALPGNPLSTYICYKLFVEPTLRILQGQPKHNKALSLATYHHYIKTTAPQDFAPYPRTRFLFADMDTGTGDIIDVYDQSSAMIKNLVLAKGALIVPADTEVRQGEELEVLVLGSE